jgi:hypothetical protein
MENNRLTVRNLKTLLLMDCTPGEKRALGKVLAEWKIRILEQLEQEEIKLMNITEDNDSSPYKFGVIPQQNALMDKLDAIKDEIEFLYDLEKAPK